MTPAYNENYLTRAGRTMGALFDTALSIMTPQQFSTVFLDSEIVRAWESGNPSYIAGKSGEDIFEELTGLTAPENEHQLYPDAEYWCGYVYCNVQWYFGCSFALLFSVLPPDELLILYRPLHEADISKTISVFHKRLYPEPALKTWREKRKLSQSQLAKISNVNLRSIKAYEQGDLEISKAQYNTLASLASALCCEIRDLLS